MKTAFFCFLLSSLIIVFTACSRPATQQTQANQSSPKKEFTPHIADKKELTAESTKTKAASAKIDIFRPAEKIEIIDAAGNKRTCKTAREALQNVKPKETIILGPGLHRGPLLLNTEGITLKGEPGAFVNANDAEWNPQWQKEPEYGPFAYSSPIPFEPGNITMNDRVTIRTDINRGGLEIHRYGIGRNDRTPLQTIFTYIPNKKRVLISFASNIDPNKQKLEAAATTTNAITIDGADNCRIENLIVTGGIDGIRTANTNNSLIQNCLVYAVDIGIHLDSKTRNTKALHCDITWNSEAMTYDCDKASGLPADDDWNAHKHHGTYDKWGVLVGGAENNEVAYNYIYEIWDGIQTDDEIPKDKVREAFETRIFKGIAKKNIGLKVHHNRIDLVMDDALEPTGELVENQWYSNLVSRSRCGLRIKTVSLGPFFICDNMLLDCGDGMRFYKSTPESATVYIYQNYFQIEHGISYHKVDSVCWDDPWLRTKIKIGTPGFYVFNNIFASNVPFSNASDGDIKPNYKADYNLYTCPPNNVLRLTSKIDTNSIFDAKPQYVAPEKANWLLQPGSPGKAQGMDLTQFKVKLPFCDKKYFEGEKPDIGLIGIELDKVPHGPVSGLWEIAAQNLDIGERNNADFALSPFRWINGSKFDFNLKDLPKKKTMDIVLMRSSPSSGSNYKVTVMDNSGKILASTNGNDKYVKVMKLTVPLNGEKELKMKITETKSAEWRVVLNETDPLVGLDFSGRTKIAKYDGGRYILEYFAPKGTKSFKISGGDKIEVSAPDGKEIIPASGGVVPVDPAGGKYLIKISFTKKGKLSFDGPDPVLYFNRDQETCPVKPEWGKPAF